MKIEENVNTRTGKRQFSKMPFVNRKNMHSQIFVCDSRELQLLDLSWSISLCLRGDLGHQLYECEDHNQAHDKTNSFVSNHSGSSLQVHG